MNKNSLTSLVMLGIVFLAASFTQNAEARRCCDRRASAAGFFAGALTGAAIAGAACGEPAYYDTSVYEVRYPIRRQRALYVYDYPTYVWNPQYAYGVDTPAYLYPRGWRDAY